MSAIKLRVSADDLPSSSRDHHKEQVRVSTFPIQRLPPELLSMIFWHAIPRRSGYVEPSINAAPLLLGRICKKWRDLADDSPELWSSISLFLFRPYSKAMKAYESWISKSSSSPLFIKIQVLSVPASERTTDRSGILEQFMDKIANQSHRWYKADISVPSYFLDTLLQNKAPLLHTLVLTDPLTSPTAGVASLPWVNTFNLSAAPALRHFVVHQPLQITPHAFHPITSIDFDAFWLSQVTDILDGCPQLEDLSVTFKSDFMFPPTVSWVFKRLKTLRVHFFHCTPRDMSIFLTRLYAPVLRSLTVDGLRTSHFSHLAQLLDHTGGALKQLSLLNISLNNKELVQYLLRVRCLESLRLVDSQGFDNACLRRLVWNPVSGANLCSDLKEVWLLRSDCQQLSPNYVAMVLTSRGGICAEETSGPLSTQSPGPLQEFRFDGSLLQHNELLQRDDIKTLISQGLRLRR